MAGSVTSNIDVQVAPNNAAAVTAAITATTPDGNGTPTGDAINAAVAYLKKLTDTNPKYILLATDGEPSCAAIPTSESTTDARPYAVTAVDERAQARRFPDLRGRHRHHQGQRHHDAQPDGGRRRRGRRPARRTRSRRTFTWPTT